MQKHDTKISLQLHALESSYLNFAILHTKSSLLITHFTYYFKLSIYIKRRTSHNLPTATTKAASLGEARDTKAEGENMIESAFDYMKCPDVLYQSYKP